MHITIPRIVWHDSTIVLRSYVDSPIPGQWLPKWLLGPANSTRGNREGTLDHSWASFEKQSNRQRLRLSRKLLEALQKRDHREPNDSWFVFDSTLSCKRLEVCRWGGIAFDLEQIECPFERRPSDGRGIEAIDGVTWSQPPLEPPVVLWCSQHLYLKRYLHRFHCRCEL